MAPCLARELVLLLWSVARNSPHLQCNGVPSRNGGEHFSPVWKSMLRCDSKVHDVRGEGIGARKNCLDTGHLSLELMFLLQTLFGVEGWPYTRIGFFSLKKQRP